MTPNTLSGGLLGQLWNVKWYDSGEVWLGVGVGIAGIGLSLFPIGSGSE